MGMKLPPDLEAKLLSMGATFGPAAKLLASQEDVAERINEKEFQSAVLALAKKHGFTGYHTYDSRKSQAGFPDLVLLRGPCVEGGTGRLIIAELKVGKNTLTAAQRTWMELFRTVAGVEVYEWRPENWPEIVRLIESRA